MDPHYAYANAVGGTMCFQRVANGLGDADDVRAGLVFAEQALIDGGANALVLSWSGVALGYLGCRVQGVPVIGFRYDEARRAVERALSLGPNLMEVQFGAGMIRLILGEGDAALGHFERAMRMSPLDPETGCVRCRHGPGALDIGPGP